LAFNNINWDDLRIFLCVARTGNLNRAAKQMRIDHSTVSRRIAQFEASLGLAVFERRRLGIKLNEAGERLLKHAETVESSIIAVCEEVGNSKVNKICGTVRLATMEGIASLYLAPRLAQLQEIAPSISVELVTSAQTVYVHRREADLFVSFFRPPGQGLVSEKIGGFHLGLYAGVNYLEKHGTPLYSDDLVRHKFVSYIEDLIQVDSVRWLNDVVNAPNVVFHSNSMIAQMNAAAGGLGLVLLPSFAVSGRHDLVPVLPNQVGTSREIWLNVHSDLQFSPRIGVVAHFLKTALKRDPIMQAF
jgi:DNA-binding transcriptional LysR family regulator